MSLYLRFKSKFYHGKSECFTLPSIQRGRVYLIRLTNELETIALIMYFNKTSKSDRQHDEIVFVEKIYVINQTKKQ